MTDKLATLSLDEDVSIITLDDGKANVFSPSMIAAVNKCLDDVPTEKGALIITGRTGMFSAGFDLKIISAGDMDATKEMSLNGFKLLSRIFSFPRPVLAACSGHGIALGTFLLCCCDYRIGVKGEFLVGANEMRTNMVIPVPILELIKFRVAQSHKYRAVLGAEMYSIENAIESVEVQAKYILIYVHNHKHFSTLQLHGQLLSVSREFKYKNTEQESWSPE